jgi:hypothetical protein
MREEARRLWAQTTLRVWPEPCRLVSLPADTAQEAAALVVSGGPLAALVLEADEVSVTVPEAAWEASGLRSRARAVSARLRTITFALDLDLAVSGYLAPAAQRLAEAGIPIVPQCAFLRDHLLVHEADLSRAVSVLEGLILDCKGK